MTVSCPARAMIMGVCLCCIRLASILVYCGSPPRPRGTFIIPAVIFSLVVDLLAR